MTYYCSDVKKFHDKFDLVTPPSFELLKPELFDFRLKFFLEEFEELQTAYDANDLGECIDALIDMVYITCGTALLHGINPEAFVQLAETGFGIGEHDVIPLGREGFEVEGPHLLSKDTHADLCKMFKRAIERFQDSTAMGDQAGIKGALVALYTNSLFASAEMNFTTEQWDELWDDVQRANMSKVRATDPSASKRGSSYDVVKPVGWIPPRTAELVARFVLEAKE